MKISHLVYSSFSSTCVHIQPIPIGVTFSKARSSKLERLFCHVSVKRDFQALSFELWALKQHLKMSPQVGLAVQDGVYKMARWGMSKDIFMYETKPYTRHLHVWRQETYMYGVGSCKRDIWTLHVYEWLELRVYEWDTYVYERIASHKCLFCKRAL